jgi:hypothetical protein
MTGLTGPTGMGVVAIPTTPTYVTASIADDANETGTISTGRTFIISHIVTDYAARVRLYVNNTARDADITRAVGISPTGNHGLMFEFITSAGALDWSVTPNVICRADSATPGITVTNLSDTEHAIDVDLTVLVLEE